MTQWRLIVNGKAAGEPALRDAVAARRARGIDVGVRVTWEHGDATRYANEAIDDGVDCIVAGGGDGTLGEVAGAIAARAASTLMPDLAVLPLGTANDFATAAGIPDELENALALVERDAVPVDVLRIEADGAEHWCMNVATGGVGTHATADVHEGLKKRLGSLSYLLGSVRAIRNMERHPVELDGPGFRWRGDMLALAIGNARQAGGGHPVCPDALIDDGALDVTVLPDLPEGVVGAVKTALTDGREAVVDEAGERARLPWVELRASTPLTLHL
ncbi:MAG TPA: lipid kinase YegS, partial [Lysobacter sp.]